RRPRLQVLHGQGDRPSGRLPRSRLSDESAGASRDRQRFDGHAGHERVRAVRRMTMQKLALLFAFLFALPAWGKPPPRKKKKATEPAPAVEMPAPEPSPPPAETRPEPAPPPAAETRPEPPPPPPKVETPPPTVADRDLDKLRIEYEQLRDALFRSRARAATV